MNTVISTDRTDPFFLTAIKDACQQGDGACWMVVKSRVGEVVWSARVESYSLKANNLMHVTLKPASDIIDEARENLERVLKMKGVL